MAEVTFLSNKTKKVLYKHLFLFLLAVITWILQFAVFSQIHFFDTIPNIMFLGCIFFGLVCGPAAGIFFGLIISFFITSIIYDHTFQFSYPLIGLISGFAKKHTFADELIFYLMLVFILALPFEWLNGLQYKVGDKEFLYDRLWSVSLYGFILNVIIAPIFYFLINFISKKLEIRA